MTSAPEQGNTPDAAPSQTDPTAQAAPAADAKENSSTARALKLLDNRWAVLGLIFFAMMALGIPLIWRCRAFLLVEKIFWTVAALVYTVVIVWLFCWVMYLVYRSIATSLGYG